MEGKDDETASPEELDGRGEIVKVAQKERGFLSRLGFAVACNFAVTCCLKPDPDMHSPVCRRQSGVRI